MARCLRVIDGMIFGLTMMLMAASGFEPLIACPAQVMRRLDRSSFIASTPCGLYIIYLQGGVKRLPHPPSPGALDADGRGRAVVASGKDLWLLEPGGKRRLEYALAEAPGKLEILGDWLLVEGRHRWLLGLYEFHQEELTKWSWRSLPARDRLHPAALAVPVPAGCRAPDIADLYAAALEAQGLALPERSSGYLGWLPEIGVSAFGGQARQVRWHEEGAWDFSAGKYAGVFVALTWHFDRWEDAGEDLRERIERERRLLRERLVFLRAAFIKHCRRDDRLALSEIRARIEMLTSTSGRSE